MFLLGFLKPVDFDFPNIVLCSLQVNVVLDAHGPVSQPPLFSPGLDRMILVNRMKEDDGRSLSHIVMNQVNTNKDSVHTALTGAEVDVKKILAWDHNNSNM